MPWKISFLFGMLVLMTIEAKPRRMPEPKHPGYEVRGADLKSFRTTGPNSDEEAPWERTDLFEGDIVVSQFRNALEKPSRRWKMPIPVCVSDDDFDEDEREMINDALYEIKSKTCVTFRACHEHDSDFIMVRGNGTGCWSSVGRLDGGQILHLQTEGCMSHGTIIHEFLHALGFYHQQSDPERDDFVNIHWENIKPQREGNFKIYKKEYTYAFNVTYDYGSVMHYGRKSFSKNGKDTITPKDPKAEIGQRAKMSPKDILKVNIFYGCDDNSVKKEEDELDDFFDF